MSQTMPTILDATERVDLHMHTTYSDGHWAPAALFDHLAAEHFRVVAVTDHDRTDSVAEMVALGAARGIRVIRGVEMTTNWQGDIAHLLCYGWQPDGALAEVARETLADQLANAQAVHAALVRQGLTFPRQAEVLADKGGAVNHPRDNIALLVAHGHAPDSRAAVEIVTAAGHRTASAPLARAVAAAHADGGVAIVAHPGRGESNAFASFAPERLAAIRAEGIPLDGIEVFYPTYTEAQRTMYAAFARDDGWLISSGSDSHGPRQRYPIPYPASGIAPLLARLGVVVR
ncbi:MAG: PHP domain-containing protein [Ktedonobacterales bacterium]|nr:PHP domain-containing protein [Ktedonobacterales bacterium]